ncbi:hypothetical protein [Nocardia pseudobrasiliensis]|uniref:Uncharacterized protein n=1 Tax=Nocardia pseudobrasiliensis TaxID=45979 RepID=A0A370HL13_9NOCA|nr:hypothetical protein [Nocardia pseudobrasiliensis]RDI59040.1 hypothetical protein DFR76_12043 [Nocardia pseudobrasiliensis]
MPSTTVTVQVDHHQFTLGAVDADTLDTRSEGTVVWAGPGFVTVLTGIAHGPVTVTAEEADVAPGTDGIEAWEAVEETILESEELLQLMRLDGEPVAGFAPILPGRYRLRVHARGRDLDFDGTATESSEQYWLRWWPTDDTDTGIRALRKTDAAYSPSTKKIPEPDQDHVYVFGPDGMPVTVAPDHPDAEAARDLCRRWGGRPASAALAADLGTYISAYYLSGLDRDLVDGIEALPPQRQRDLARFSAHAAFEQAGLTDVPDFADALTAMDENRSAPPDFANSSLARHRLDTDADIPLTLVSGLPGSSEQVQQYPAMMTYFVAVDIGDSMQAAFDAVRYAATAFGMDYPQLFARIRQEFFAGTE